MRVVNMRDEEYDVRIDRSTILGNPYKIGKDGTRKEVIEKYRKRLWECIQLVDKLNKLAEMPDDTILGCWCKPKECHGDVLIKVIEYLKNRERR